MEDSSSSESSDIPGIHSEESSIYDAQDIRGYSIIPQKLLFNVLENGQEIERTVADNWIQWYDQNKIEAIAELLQLFISTLGYDHLIALPDDKALMHSAFVNHITILEHTFANGQDYLLCKHDMHRYREKYCNMLKKIVILSREYVLYDDFFLKTVTGFLMLLCESHIVVHQHLAIITALSLFTPLTRIEFNIRKYEAFEIDKLEYVEDVMRDLYDGIIGRFMISESDDVFRSCLTALRQWIVYDHYGYCSRPHLTHLLEAMTHSECSIRISAISTIHKLYKTCTDMRNPEDDRFKELEEFSKDSRHELLRLCYMDIPRICCVAIEIVKFIDMLFPGVFLKDDLKVICRLVFVKSQVLARAAGSFLWYYISTKHNNVEIISLIMFYVTHKSPNWDTGTLIDALWNEITKDVFEKMVLFLDRMLHTEFNPRDFMPSQDSLDITEATIEHEDLEILVETLLELILSYIRQATIGRTKRDRNKKKVFSDLDLLEIKLKTNHLTETFMDKIVKFINSMYDYNVHCVSMALEITRHFNFELYIGKNELMEDLVLTLSRSLDEQKDHSIVHECIHSLVTLRQSNIEEILPIVTPLDNDIIICFEVFSEYWERAADIDFSNFLGEMLVNQDFAIELFTSKISSLIRYMPLDCGSQIDQMINIIVMFIADYEPEHSFQFVPFFKDCLRIQYYYLMRQLNLLLPEDGISRVLYRLNDQDKNRLDILLGILFQIMATPQIHLDLRILAFEQLCDLFITCKFSSDMVRAEFVLLQEYEQQLPGFWIFVEKAIFLTSDGLEELSITQKRKLLIFYFQLIWKNIIPYEYFKVVTKHIRDHPELKKVVGEMIKTLRSVQKYNPHIKITQMIFH